MAVWPARCLIKPSCFKSPHNPGYDAGPQRWVSSQGTDGSQLWSASQRRWEERLVGLRPVLGERGWVDKSSEARLLHRGEHESPRWLATAKTAGTFPAMSISCCQLIYHMECSTLPQKQWRQAVVVADTDCQFDRL